MLKVYIVITITTIIVGMLASTRLKFNKNIKTEAEKIKEKRKGDMKTSGVCCISNTTAYFIIWFYLFTTGR